MKKDRQILEGSRAIALTIKNIKPNVISAYPITPQTHIVEDLAKFKANGKTNYEYVRAESEFAAASIVLGASAAGSRAYSATSSQGILLMTEVLFNIAGMRLPVVITCANRAVSAPISIWNDHSDAMTVRDSGWIQFFAENHQEAVYQHILAFKIAEQLKLPVLVNVDGFILTHSYEPVSIPTTTEIKKYLPKYSPKEYLNPQKPVTMGAFFDPSQYMEVREQLHNDLTSSTSIIKKEYNLLKQVIKFKSNDNGLVEYYGNKNAKTIIIAMGSMAGTIKETIQKRKDVALIKIKTYRPFPQEEISKLTKKAKNIAVTEKAISLGQAGPLYIDVKASLNKNLNIKNYIVGLGGRDVTKEIINKIVKDANKQNNKIKFYG